MEMLALLQRGLRDLHGASDTRGPIAGDGHCGIRL